ncbi:MAG: redox-sensing transcriptional repressor Rex [Ruminococcaceae bacterium]|nr:redox-sensing transcriptional repressor Rex [Oscillospiraceae bacterium]
MQKNKKETAVSAAVIKRLPRYFRYLRMLLNENKLRVSSNELADMMNVTASQIRQDLNCFGGFGQQGYGYNVTYLYGKISEILGVNENYQAIIVGAGRLGQALASSPVFTKRGVEVCALFDKNPEIIGKEIDGRRILDISELKEFCNENLIDIAVLTLPSDHADEAAKLVASIGIKGIWNFTSKEISASDYPGVTVQSVHMGDSLMMLCYDLRSKDE